MALASDNYESKKNICRTTAAKTKQWGNGPQTCPPCQHQTIRRRPRLPDAPCQRRVMLIPLSYMCRFLRNVSANFLQSSLDKIHDFGAEN
jgi:hypothetical protein